MVTHCRQPEMVNNKETQSEETGTRETQSCGCRDVEPVFAHHNAGTPTSNSKYGIKTCVSDNYKRVFIPMSILVLPRENICAGVALHSKADRRKDVVLRSQGPQESLLPLKPCILLILLDCALC